VLWVIDDALSKMNAELSIDLPKPRRGEGRREQSPRALSALSP
jgi:hypothetical protein